MNPDLIEDLRGIVEDPSSVVNAESVLETHGRDSHHSDGPLPDVVVFPSSTADVCRILAWADANGTPVTPFGAGSSLDGHILPLQNGISLDMTRMNRVLEVAADDRTAIVQAGVTRLQLNRRLSEL